MIAQLRKKLAGLSARERRIGIAAGAVLGLLLMDRVLFRPWMRGTQDVYAKIEKLERSLATQRALLARRPQVEARMNALAKEVRFADKPEKELAALIREIEGFGEKSGLDLAEVKPVAGEADGTYQERAFVISFEGSLLQWIRFIYLVQTSPSLFHVEQASLQLEDEKAGRLAGSVQLRSIAIQGEEPAHAAI